MSTVKKWAGQDATAFPRRMLANGSLDADKVQAWGREQLALSAQIPADKNGHTTELNVRRSSHETAARALRAIGDLAAAKVHDDKAKAYAAAFAAATK